MPDSEGRFETAKLSLDLARSRSLLICTPIARDPAWQYTASLVDTVRTLERLGIAHECRFIVGNSHLPKARNELCAEFLASPYSHMLFIDDDMGWRPDAVVRLLASDHEFIGAAGRKRTDKPNSDPAVWCVRWQDRDMVQDRLGAIKVAAVGTGFLRLARSVFEKIMAADPSLRREGHDRMSEAVRAHYHRFFSFGDDGMRELSEDFHFCDRWCELGGEVWVDPEINLTHAGSHAYSGALSEILVAAAVAA